MFNILKADVIHSQDLQHKSESDEPRRGLPESRKED